MRFIKRKLSQVLEDLGVPFREVLLTPNGVKAVLEQKTPFSEVMEKLRANPKYGPRMSIHPWGVYLSFKNLNCPDQRALADICLDFRSKGGGLASVKGVLVFARVFTGSGEVINCLSLQDLNAAAKTSLYVDQEEAVIDAA